MKKLIFFFIITLLASFLGVRAQDLKDIRDEIVLYNLINGLYLDKSQEEFILQRAKEVKDFQERMERELEKYYSEGRGLLLALKEEVKKEVPDVSPDIAGQIRQGKIKKAKLCKEYESFLEEKVKEVKAILNDNQLYTLENFRPCLIPPKGPARVGQDYSGEWGLNFLKRIRRIPPYRYDLKKYEIADEVIERFALLHPYFEKNRADKVKEEIIKIMDETRALNEVEFELQGKQKAIEFKEVLKKKDKEVNIEEKIAKFLLSPSIIPILDERIGRN
jgi:hypothetical protein